MASSREAKPQYTSGLDALVTTLGLAGLDGICLIAVDTDGTRFVFN